MCSGSSSRGRNQSHKAWSQLRLRKPAAGLSGLPGPSMCSRPLASPSLGWPALVWGPSVFPSESGPHCVYRSPLQRWVPLFFFENRLLVFGCAGSSSLRRLFPGGGEQGPLCGCAARPAPCSALSGGARAPGDRLTSRVTGLAALRAAGSSGSGVKATSPALAGGFFPPKCRGNCPGFPFSTTAESEAPFSRRQRKY